jgi:hypothetical protein
MERLEGGRSRVAFRMVFERAEKEVDISPFAAATNCGAWFPLDELTYGDWSMGEFIFTLDAQGEAVSVEPRFLRTTLNKVKSS